MTVSSSELRFKARVSVSARAMPVPGYTPPNIADGVVVYRDIPIDFVNESSVIEKKDFLLFYILKGDATNTPTKRQPGVDFDSPVLIPEDLYTFTESSPGNGQNVRTNLQIEIKFERIASTIVFNPVAPLTGQAAFEPLAANGSEFLIIRRESQIGQNYKEGEANGLQVQLDKQVEKLQDISEDVQRTIRFLDEEGSSPVTDTYVTPKEDSIIVLDNRKKL